MLTTLSQLTPGTRFRAPWTKNLYGTLQRLGAGSATVLVERPKRREFTTAQGKKVVIERSHERSEWSLETTVEV